MKAMNTDTCKPSLEHQLSQTSRTCTRSPKVTLITCVISMVEVMVAGNGWILTKLMIATGLKESWMLSIFLNFSTASSNKSLSQASCFLKTTATHWHSLVSLPSESQLALQPRVHGLLLKVFKALHQSVLLLEFLTSPALPSQSLSL